jgi:hypothetical protein
MYGSRNVSRKSIISPDALSGKTQGYLPRGLFCSFFVALRCDASFCDPQANLSPFWECGKLTWINLIV